MRKSSNNLSHIWEITKGGRLLYILSLVVVIVNLFFHFLFPQIVAFVVDSIVGDIAISKIPIIKQIITWMYSNITIPKDLIVVSILAMLVAVSDGITSFVANQMVAVSSEKMIKKLRDRVYSHIQHLPYSWHVEAKTGDIIQRCTTDMEVIRTFIATQFSEIFRTILIVTVAYIILFPLNTTMAWVSFAFLPIIGFYSFNFYVRSSKLFQKADEDEGKVLSIAQENLTGVRVVRAFGKEQHEVERFNKQHSVFIDTWKKLGKLMAKYNGVADFIPSFQMILMCLLGVWQAYLGNITVGTFVIFISYNAMAIWPVRGLGRLFAESSKTKVAIERIWEILETPIEEDDSNKLDTVVNGDIEFKNVSFSHGEHKVLDNVSFKVKEGTTLGIIGATGSGKTTVTHLLCGLYDLDKADGEITIGGVNINDYNRKSLRSSVGIVLQEPFLFSRTIKENIAGLRGYHSIDDIREAAKVASVDDNIMEFTKGYDTVVGERGVTLSGGQKQRVAISRLVLGDSPIMIFDDSLSAVDTETDTKIRQGLAKRKRDVTTIIVSHRITSVASSDRIIVMEEGKVIEQGTHEELIAQKGDYYRIYTMQEKVS